jgi:hypothetical protein
VTRRRAAIVALLVAALGAAAWASLAPFPSESRTLTFVIAPGTADRLKAGDPFKGLPSPIHLTIGIRDILVLTNDDTVAHQLGPIILGPRQVYRIPFRRPGRLQYACSLHATGVLTIVIAPEPATGLPRLRWRLGTLLGRDHV